MSEEWQCSHRDGDFCTKLKEATTHQTGFFLCDKCEHKISCSLSVGDFIDYGAGPMEIREISIDGMLLRHEDGTSHVEPYEVMGLANPFK